MCTTLLYTRVVKDITPSADENLIDLASERAKARHTTLNEAFNEWLADYTRSEYVAKAIEECYARLSYVNSGRKYTREEMNER